jgi:serine/threonine protein kinase
LPKKSKKEYRKSMAIVTVKNGISTMQNICSPISQSIKKKYIGRYEVINVLGRGAFGTVKQGVDPVNGQSVSIVNIQVLV